MAAPLTITVDGVPVAKGRAKATTVNGYVRHYTPPKTRNYENWVRMCGVQAMARDGRSTTDDALHVEILVYVPIPKSWSKKRKGLALEWKIHPTPSPDLSNYVKAVEDGLNGIVWGDDSQIVNLSARKVYGDHPKMVVTVNRLRSA